MTSEGILGSSLRLRAAFPEGQQLKSDASHRGEPIGGADRTDWECISFSRGLFKGNEEAHMYSWLSGKQTLKKHIELREL